MRRRHQKVNFRFVAEKHHPGVFLQVLNYRRILIVAGSQRNLHNPKPLKSASKVLQLFETANTGISSKLVKEMGDLQRSAVSDLLIKHGVDRVIDSHPCVELKDMGNGYYETVSWLKVLGHIS